MKRKSFAGGILEKLCSSAKGKQTCSGSDDVREAGERRGAAAGEDNDFEGEDEEAVGKRGR